MESVRQASSLPSGVFRAASPTIERALAADVGDIFLRHMSRTDRVSTAQDGPRAHQPDPTIEARNAVSDEELAALVGELRRQIKVSAPHIDDRLDQERTWILLNLALTSSPTLRGHALAELRATVGGKPEVAAVLEAATEMLARCDRDSAFADTSAPAIIEEIGRSLAELRRSLGADR